MQEGDTAGRATSARGLRRRQLLLQAAGELVREHGIGAVSHRGVAQRAGLPLAATTYYFTSLEDLLEGAVRHLAHGWLTAAEAVAADLPPLLDDPRLLAEALVRVAALGPAGGGAGDAHALLSLYDRFLEAARHPRLRPVVAEYNACIDEVLVEILGRRAHAEEGGAGRTARLVLAVIDGALLRALAEGLPLDTATTAVEQLLTALATAPRERA